MITHYLFQKIMTKNFFPEIWKLAKFDRIRASIWDRSKQVDPKTYCELVLIFHFKFEFHHTFFSVKWGLWISSLCNLTWNYYALFVIWCGFKNTLSLFRKTNTNILGKIRKLLNSDVNWWIKLLVKQHCTLWVISWYCRTQIKVTVKTSLWGFCDTKILEQMVLRLVWLNLN